MDEEVAGAFGGNYRSESEASEGERSGGELSSEASEEENPDNEEGKAREEAEPEAKGPPGGKKKKRKRKVSAGHRRKIRRRYDCVDEFNPAARSAHTEELERIRRLELQQSIRDTSPPEGTLTEATGPGEGALIGEDNDQSTAPCASTSGSPDLMLVDLTEAEGMEDEKEKMEAIVIGSSSDSESEEDSQESSRGKGRTAKAVKKGAERLNRKYDIIEPHPDGKVLINVGHPSTEGDVFLAPQIAAAAKPHQVGGIRFLYDNIVESLTRFPISTGFGCILAHSMGLGKTLQVIGFIDIFLRHTPGKHVLCVVPVNTLQNWIAEFDRWLPTDASSDDKKKMGVLGQRLKMKKSPSPFNGRSHSLRLSRTSPQPLLTHAVSSPGQSAQQGGGEEGQRATEPMASSGSPSTIGLQALLAPVNQGTLSEARSSPSPLPETARVQTSLIATSASPTGSPMVVEQVRTTGPPVPPDGGYLSQNGPYLASAGSSPDGIEQHKNTCELEGSVKSGDGLLNLAEVSTSCETQSPSPLGGGASGRSLNGHSPEPEVIFRSFQLFVLCETSKTMESRLALLSQWRKEGGVLLVGYELYRLLSLSVPSLAGNKMAVRRKKPAKKVETESNTIDLDENEKEMDQLIEIQQALCHPGPDLVVCDEGHRIKNDYSNISQALKKIRTKRRVVMTGYPLQNNLMEYWCMVDFVRPNYLGKKQEFADLFERPITNGQCTDSTPSDVRLMRYRSHVLHALLEGFVLRRGHEILKATLLPKFEHVLYVRPSEAQAALYNFFMDQLLQGGSVSSPAGPLRAFAVCSKIWNHPDIYYNEAMAQESKRASPTSWLDETGLPRSLLFGSASSKNEPASLCKIDWPSPLLPSYKPGLLSNSLKMMVAVELVDRAVQMGDRVLVFSQSLPTLSYTEKLLSQRHIPIPNSAGPDGTIQYSNQKWTKNRNYCRLDGSTSSTERDRLINSFNSSQNKECWLFLLSTRAGCLGVNLIGANRVIVMDVSWNPCYDSQAVCRVYRYGQEKPCYIYRLVCDGTMERKIFDRQISKQGMANRVVDELHPERHFTANDIITLMAKLAPLPAPKDLSASANEFLFDPVLMQLCKTLGPLFTKLPLRHESLLLVSEDERMTEVEKYVAMKGFQQDWWAIRRQPTSQAQSYRTQQPINSGQNQQRSQVQQQQQQLSQGQQVSGRTVVPNVRVTAVRSPLPQGNIPQVASSQNLPKSPSSGASPNPAPQAGSSGHGTSKYDGVEVICLDSDSEDEGSPCNISTPTVSAALQRPSQPAQYTAAGSLSPTVSAPVTSTAANLILQTLYSPAVTAVSSGTLLPGPRVISAPITGATPLNSALTSTIADILAAAKAGGGSSDAGMRAVLAHAAAETQTQNSGSGTQIRSPGNGTQAQTSRLTQAQTSRPTQARTSRPTQAQTSRPTQAQMSRPTAVAPALSPVTAQSQALSVSSQQQQQQSSPVQSLTLPLPLFQAVPTASTQTVVRGPDTMAPSPSRSPVRSPVFITSAPSTNHQTRVHIPEVVQLHTSGDSHLTRQQATSSTISLDRIPMLPSPTANEQQVSTTSMDRTPRQQMVASPKVTQQATSSSLDLQEMLASPTANHRQVTSASTLSLDRSPKQQVPSPTPPQEQATITHSNRSPRQQMLALHTGGTQHQASAMFLDRIPRQQTLPSPTASQQQATSVPSDRSPRQQMLPSPKSPSSVQLLSPGKPPTPRAGMSPTGNRRTSPPWYPQPPDSSYEPSSIPLLSPVAARLFQLSQARDRDSASRSVSPSPTSTPSPVPSSSSSLPLPSLAPLSGKKTAVVPPYSAIATSSPAFPNSNQPSPPPLVSFQSHGVKSLPQQAASNSLVPRRSDLNPRDRDPSLQAAATSNSVQSSIGRHKTASILDLTDIL